MKIRIWTAALLGLLVMGCDGSGSSLPPSNSAPTVSTIADQSISANLGSAAIAFIVTDENTGNLSFTASSDNQLVVADSGLAVTNTGASASIAVTPVNDTVGDALITITVSDQAGQSASTSFLLTVVPQQLSLQQFVRSEFAQVEDGQPAMINAVVFDQDANNDDFADLLAQ